MRDYGIVSPRFWIGETGKQLRGSPMAQLLAVYLMTSPHSNMTGVFHCPVIYMAHETGMDVEATSKALARLSEVGFCEYDEASETIFVVRMAAYQIGESLKAGDNRIAGLRKEVEKMVPARMKDRFLAVYGQAYRLVSESEENQGANQPPSKPLRSQEQEQEQEQEKNTTPPPASPPGVPDGFAKFWTAWPAGGRKEAKGKCLEAWKRVKAEAVAEQVLAHVERLKASQGWRKNGGEFIPAPLVYLNGRRWEGAEDGEGASGAATGVLSEGHV